MPPLRALCRDAGRLLLVPAPLALTGALVAALAHEPSERTGFLLTAALSLAAGGALLLAGRGAADTDAREQGAERTVALAWLGAIGLCAVPFLAAGLSPDAGRAALPYASAVNALFESASGLTSTGLSVSPYEGELPRSILWWRSLLQWTGGIGILYLVFGLMPGAGGAARATLVSAEEDPPEDESERARFPAWVWAIYVGLTALAVVGLWATGVPLWEALNHGMVTVATGGFDVTGTSMHDYTRAQQTVAMLAIVSGSVSFGVYYLALVRRQYGRIARDRQNQLLVAFVLAGAALLWLAATAVGHNLSAFDALFQTVSALCTAGFSSVALPDWPAALLLLLLPTMLLGAAAGSTVGGFKMQNVVWLGRWARGTLGGQGVQDHGRPALKQLVRFVLTWAAGAGLLVVLGADPVQGAFEAASAIGTVGLSSGLTSPDLPAASRVVLTLLMWMGRLEVAAALALVARRLGE
jgi:trk system potassium uptake protein TrkH